MSLWAARDTRVYTTRVRLNTANVQARRIDRKAREQRNQSSSSPFRFCSVFSTRRSIRLECEPAELTDAVKPADCRPETPFSVERLA